MAYNSKEYHKLYREEHKEELNTYCRDYYHEHKEERRDSEHARQKEYRQKERRLALEHYGGAPSKCDCCGETEMMFLTIDHIDGCKYEDVARSGHHLYRSLRLHNYPDGYRVLCYNCNCSMGNFGYCPHNGGSNGKER